MIEVSLGTKVELIRYYKRKKDKTYRVSKTPIANINADCEYCREALCRNIYKALKSVRKRGEVNNHYYLIPHPIFTLENGKKYIPTSTLRMSIGDTADRNLYEKFKEFKELPDKFTKLTECILGIINVCMVSNQEEKERIRMMIKDKVPIFTFGKHRKDYQTVFTIEYNRISPWWMTSQILTSYIFLLFRLALDFYSNEDEILVVDELLDSISYTELKDILNTMDYDRAYKFYKKYLLPFFDEIYSDDNYFSNDDKRKLLEEFMNGKVFNLFNPRALVNYWNDDYEYDEDGIYRDGCYGIKSYIDDILNERDGNEERYDDDIGEEVNVIPIKRILKGRRDLN